MQTFMLKHVSAKINNITDRKKFFYRKTACQSILKLFTNFLVQAVCTVVAPAMHYFFLVAFCWMFIEALALYLNVVKVFNTHFKMWPIYGFSWGK